MVTKIVVKGIIGVGIIYVLILIYPNIFFSYKYEYRNFQIHSDKPISPSIDFVIDDTIDRIKESELYDTNYKFNLFLCNDNWRLKLFSRNGDVGGFVNYSISPNIYIRESDIENNELIPPGEWMYTPEERPLSYFIAHETIHSLQRKHNLIFLLRGPVHITEWYADYIAKKPDFDYDTYTKLYLENNYFMNPISGLYHKYHYYISYLMDKKWYTYDRVIDEQPDLEDTLKKASGM